MPWFTPVQAAIAVISFHKPAGTMRAISPPTMYTPPKSSPARCAKARPV
jgi:hypothetical protein